jgi:hypothetical protein
MLDYVLLARARKMLADEANELHGRARLREFSWERERATREVVTAEACDYAAQSLHNVLSKADAFLDDEQAREALRHE